MIILVTFSGGVLYVVATAFVDDPKWGTGIVFLQGALW
jgi:hypothetical protein